MSTVETYRDGGTVCISENGVQFCIDNRMGSDTKGSLYNNYPTRGSIVHDKDNLILFLSMVSRIENAISENEYLIVDNVVSKIQAGF